MNPPLLGCHENALLSGGIQPGGVGCISSFEAALTYETARFHLRVQTACPHAYQVIKIDRLLLLRDFLWRGSLLFLFGLLLLGSLLLFRGFLFLYGLFLGSFLCFCGLLLLRGFLFCGGLLFSRGFLSLSGFLLLPAGYHQKCRKNGHNKEQYKALHGKYLLTGIMR